MLDCETPEGQKAIAREEFVKDFFAKKENVTIKTPKYKANNDDGLMYRGGKLMGVCEIKSRIHWGRDAKTPFTYATLKEGSYLITESKLAHLQQMSRKHKVNSYILLDIPHDKCILTFRVTDRHGNFLIKYESQRTSTYNTVNDYKGKVKRMNAFISIRDNKRHIKLFNYGC